MARPLASYFAGEVFAPHGHGGLRLSMALGRVRRAIVAGRLVRRRIHGQPYWAEAS